MEKSKITFHVNVVDLIVARCKVKFSLTLLYSSNPATFYWSTCTKTGRGADEYLCVNGIDFASFYHFDISYWDCSDGAVFFIFHFITGGNNIPYVQRMVSFYMHICLFVVFFSSQRLGDTKGVARRRKSKEQPIKGPNEKKRQKAKLWSMTHYTEN